MYGVWLEGVHHIQITLDGVKEGKVSGKDLPWLGSKSKDVCSAGLRKAFECVCVCVCVCVGVFAKALSIATPKPHTHAHTHTHARYTVDTHTASPLLFILVTGFGSGVILLQY